MKYSLRTLILILLLSYVSISFSQEEEGKELNVNYRGHDVSLINKHGWLYKTQSDFDVYISRYYTWVSERLNKDQPGQIGYVTANSTNVSGYRFDIDIQSPSDHILSVYTHERPVIARKWRAD